MTQRAVAGPGSADEDAGPASRRADALGSEHSRELVREACTMALYVAVCLLAAFAALPGRGHVLPIVWGVTVGLALAHWFAFRVSARLVGVGAVSRADVVSGAAQLAGAVAVAVLATVPVLVLPHSVELLADTLVLAAFIGVFGYAVARGGGSSRIRALVYAVIVLACAVAIALLKHALGGH